MTLGPSPLLTWRRHLDTGVTMPEALDELAWRGILAAEAEEKTQAFLAARGGPLWAALGLFAGRAFIRTDATWQQQGPGAGAWCVMLPLLGCVPTDPEVRRRMAAAPRPREIPAERWHVEDVLAIDDSEARVATLSGAFDGVLGCPFLAMGDAPRALRVYRQPVDWLQHALDAWAGPDMPEPICLAWPKSSGARDVLLHAGELIADDDDHAAQLDRWIKKARKDLLPPAPRLKVARKKTVAEAA